MSRLLGGLMQKAQKIKLKADELKAELKNREVSGQSVDGSVKVTATCDNKLTSINISDEKISDDKEATESAVMEAINDALSKTGKAQKDAGKKAMAEFGLNLPGLF